MQGGVAADEGRGDQPARADGAAGLAQRADAVGALVQVVERAQQQCRVGRPVGDGQVAGVAQAGLHAGQRRGLLDVQRHGVDQLDVVARGGQPRGVHAGAAAHVEHLRRRRRQRAQQHVTGTPELQPPPPFPQPGQFAALLVVTQDTGILDHAAGSYNRRFCAGEAIFRTTFRQEIAPLRVLAVAWRGRYHDVGN